MLVIRKVGHYSKLIVQRGYNMNTKLDTTVQTSNFKNHKFGNKQKLLVNLQMLQFTMY